MVVLFLFSARQILSGVWFLASLGGCVWDLFYRCVWFPPVACSFSVFREDSVDLSRKVNGLQDSAFCFQVGVTCQQRPGEEPQTRYRMKAATRVDAGDFETEGEGLTEGVGEGQVSLGLLVFLFFVGGCCYLVLCVAVFRCELDVHMCILVCKHRYLYNSYP